MCYLPLASPGLLIYFICGMHEGSCFVLTHVLGGGDACLSVPAWTEWFTLYCFDSLLCLSIPEWLFLKATGGADFLDLAPEGIHNYYGIFSLLLIK